MSRVATISWLPCSSLEIQLHVLAGFHIAPALLSLLTALGETIPYMGPMLASIPAKRARGRMAAPGGGRQASR